MLLGLLKLDRGMVSPILGLDPHNLGSPFFLNLGLLKILGLQVIYQKEQRRDGAKKDKRNDLDINNVINQNIKKTPVGIYMANPSARNQDNIKNSGYQTWSIKLENPRNQKMDYLILRN